MSKHFCCCIPVRFGVFILSLLSLLGAGASAGLIWWLIASGPSRGVVIEGNLKIGLYVAAALYTVFALFALAGFIGALIRSRALVRTFSVFLWIQLVISLAQTILFAIALFNQKVQSTIITECISRTSNLQESIDHATANTPGASHIEQPSAAEIKASCQNLFKGSRVGFIISFVCFFFVTLYCCIIVQRYGNQLSEEQAYKASSHPLQPSSSSTGSKSYYPHAPLSQHEQGYGAGSGANYQYPYAKPEHGFGSH